MNLFSNNNAANLLPFDGIVHYYGRVFSPGDSDSYFDILWKTIEWRNDEANMFGRHIITKRKVAWYGDSNYHYTYSNATKLALPWTKELLELKSVSEAKTGATYNSCLLNLYHDGSEGMAWHSDDEKMLASNSSIASLTFGAERKFAFRHKTLDQKVEIILEHGSLLEMAGTTQKFWLHRLPPTKKVTRPRINLTFRKMETALQ
jgi:alkylated DNA repair dioxygenase AlkB